MDDKNFIIKKINSNLKKEFLSKRLKENTEKNINIIKISDYLQIKLNKKRDSLFNKKNQTKIIPKVFKRKIIQTEDDNNENKPIIKKIDEKENLINKIIYENYLKTIKNIKNIN